MSLTNTDPNKVARYPKFDWPRVTNPEDSRRQRRVARGDGRCARREQAFMDHPDEIAAIIIEPIQGEGGDNHFRPEFLQSLRDLADKKDALLIFDEVQTGVGLTGEFWAFQSIRRGTPDMHRLRQEDPGLWHPRGSARSTRSRATCS